MVKILIVEDSQPIIDTFISILTPAPLQEKEIEARLNANEDLLFNNLPHPPVRSFASRVTTKDPINDEVTLKVATNLQDAKVLFTSFQPDIVITDHQFPSFAGGSIEDNGFKMISFVKNSMQKDTQVVWNSSIDRSMVPYALQKGADHAFSKFDLSKAQLTSLIDGIKADLRSRS